MDRPDTLIQSHFQRTARFVVAAIWVACCCSQSTAQTAFPRNAYTIIGDVELPATYDARPGQRITLQTLLQQAKALGPSGTATIRTANQPERASVSILNNLESPIGLNPGDTVVWRSIQGSNLDAGNVALLTDQGPKLQTIPIAGVDLTTLKQTAGLHFNQPVVAHRNGWSQQHSFQMNPRIDSVQHGDVLDVRSSTANQNVTPVVRNSNPDWSENSTVKTVSLPNHNQVSSTSIGLPTDTMNSAGGLRVPAASERPSSLRTMPAPLASSPDTLQIPSSPFDQADDTSTSASSPSSEAAMFTEVMNSSSLSSNTTANTPDDSNTVLDQLAEEALNPKANLQKSDTQSILSVVFLLGLVLAIGLITIGIVRTRQEQRLHRQLRAVPTGIQSSPSRQGGTSHERQLETKSAIFSDLSQLPAESITQLPAFSAELSKKSLDVAHQAKEDNVSVERVILEDTDSDLENCPVLSVGLEDEDADTISLAAKFSEDKTETDQDSVQHSRVTDFEIESQPAAELAQEQPLVDAPIDLTAWITDEPVEQETRQVSLIVDDVEDVSLQDEAENQRGEAVTIRLLNPEVTSPQDSTTDEPILQLPDVDALRDALAISGETSEPVETAGEPESSLPLETEITEQIEIAETDTAASTTKNPQTIQDQEDIMAHPPMTQAEAQYLEDLIQNRLPMELSETQLPLKINLFGKPEGPRRLRIDAAHSTIAAPHMASTGSRSKRREPAMAMKNDTVQKAAKQADAVERPVASSSDGVASQTTISPEFESATSRQPQVAPQSPTSGLDKALNFLEEQSKS